MYCKSCKKVFPENDEFFTKATDMVGSLINLLEKSNIPAKTHLNALYVMDVVMDCCNKPFILWKQPKEGV